MNRSQFALLWATLLLACWFWLDLPYFVWGWRPTIDHWYGENRDRLAAALVVAGSLAFWQSKAYPAPFAWLFTVPGRAATAVGRAVGFLWQFAVPICFGVAALWLILAGVGVGIYGDQEGERLLAEVQTRSLQRADEREALERRLRERAESDALKLILRPIGEPLRTNAWHAYQLTTGQDDFRRRFDPMSIPRHTKAELWNLKFVGPRHAGVGDGWDVAGDERVRLRQD